MRASLDFLTRCITPTLFSVFVILLTASTALAQPSGYNYDEEKVPSFDLPDPLVATNGKRVENAEAWRKVRRPELLRLFEKQVYGRPPGKPEQMRFEVVEQSGRYLDGKAIRRQVVIHLSEKENSPKLELLLYLPADAKTPTPVFLGLNFAGNHSIEPDPAIRLTSNWLPGRYQGVEENRATEKARGISTSRWPVAQIIERGYGVATMYNGDIDPDFHDEFKNGVHPLFYKDGQSTPADDGWGTISAWAWGLSRALDYLETDDAVDAKRVAVLGHSRLGKTSLWAGARDERFAITISNDSGCGGAALSRRHFGETVQRINTSFPHWFCGNFKKYNENENACAVDQHELVALVAPRAVYVASAVEDRWADPRGEFLSCKYAAPVFELLADEKAADSFPTEEMPSINSPVMGRIGYHIRSGKHDLTEYDWQRYMDFADKQYGK